MRPFVFPPASLPAPGCFPILFSSNRPAAT